MALTRIQYWDTRSFSRFLLQRASEPFVWGKNDCALMAADGIEAITGVDIAADFRGKYGSEEEAFALIRELTGGETVEDAAAYCAAKAGLREWELPLCARRGDLVVLEDAGRIIAGLVHLNGREVVAVGDAGLKRLPIAGRDDAGAVISLIKRAWNV
jgi:hypothetical protein